MAEQGDIVPARKAIVCRLCHRAIEAVLVEAASGVKKLEVRCPKHGALGKGEKMLVGYSVVFGGEEDGGE
jgi:hypothetical protein